MDINELKAFIGSQNTGGKNPYQMMTLLDPQKVDYNTRMINIIYRSTKNWDKVETEAQNLILEYFTSKESLWGMIRLVFFSFKMIFDKRVDITRYLSIFARMREIIDFLETTEEYKQFKLQNR